MHRARSFLDDKRLEPVLRGIEGRGAHAVVECKADREDMRNFGRLQYSQEVIRRVFGRGRQSRVSKRWAKCRVGLDAPVLPFVDDVREVLPVQLEDELAAGCALNAVVWPEETISRGLPVRLSVTKSGEFDGLTPSASHWYSLDSRS